MAMIIRRSAVWAILLAGLSSGVLAGEKTVVVEVVDLANTGVPGVYVTALNGSGVTQTISCTTDDRGICELAIDEDLIDAENYGGLVLIQASGVGPTVEGWANTNDYFPYLRMQLPVGGNAIGGENDAAPAPAPVEQSFQVLSRNTSVTFVVSVVDEAGPPVRFASVEIDYRVISPTDVVGADVARGTADFKGVARINSPLPVVTMINTQNIQSIEYTVRAKYEENGKVFCPEESVSGTVYLNDPDHLNEIEGSNIYLPTVVLDCDWEQ